GTGGTVDGQGVVSGAGLLTSRLLMIGLLSGGRFGQLLREETREGLEKPPTLNVGQSRPELGQANAVRQRLRARGGIRSARRWDMVNPLGRRAAAAAGSSNP